MEDLWNLEVENGMEDLWNLDDFMVDASIAGSERTAMSVKRTAPFIVNG
jgi:hypothetical protein